MTASTADNDEPNTTEDPHPWYRVEIDVFCDSCGRDAWWWIVGPDDIAMGRSFSDKEQAEDWAEELSLAYEAGRRSANAVAE